MRSKNRRLKQPAFPPGQKCPLQYGPLEYRRQQEQQKQLNKIVIFYVTLYTVMPNLEIISNVIQRSRSRTILENNFRGNANQFFKNTHHFIKKTASTPRPPPQKCLRHLVKSPELTNI